jgi:MerR family copper efflux transcriptional regulator
MQIGEVAERTGLSLRTIRYYEEVALALPSARSSGGFRLYTAQDVERLELVKRMKLIDLSVDEMRDLLTTLDRLEDAAMEAEEVESLRARLGLYQELTRQRVETLQAQLANAEAFSADLHAHADRLPGATEQRR